MKQLPYEEMLQHLGGPAQSVETLLSFFGQQFLGIPNKHSQQLYGLKILKAVV